jgi:RNA polymerase sigma-70 factor (ECF subfamily)
MPSELAPECLGDDADRLYRAARGLCDSRDEAEDLVQETFARVLARPRRLRNGDELAYLLGALRYTFFDLRRRRGPLTTPFDEGIQTDAGVRAAVAVEVIATAHEVLRAVTELPAAFREVLVAVDVAGLSYADVARSLAIPIGTVMSRLYRARQRVAESFI